MPELFYIKFNTLLGEITLISENEMLKALYFSDTFNISNFTDLINKKEDPFLNDVSSQILSYLSGKLKKLDIKFNIEKGSLFQQTIWKSLLNIPYGKTCSYTDIGNITGYKNHVRAIGSAIGKNPISIIIPCHRVILKSGGYGGYSGGIWRKQKLLEIETLYGKII